MANPVTIPMAWATNGSKATIPSTKSSTGRASWSEGFPTETSLPLNAGGIPPNYLDFQGVLNALSQHAVFLQNGGTYLYTSGTTYPKGAIIMGSDGNVYVALKDNSVNPVGDTTGAWAFLSSKPQTTDSSSSSSDTIIELYCNSRSYSSTDAYNAADGLSWSTAYYDLKQLATGMQKYSTDIQLSTSTSQNAVIGIHLAGTFTGQSLKILDNMMITAYQSGTSSMSKNGTVSMTNMYIIGCQVQISGTISLGNSLEITGGRLYKQSDATTAIVKTGTLLMSSSGMDIDSITVNSEVFARSSDTYTMTWNSGSSAGGMYFMNCAMDGNVFNWNGSGNVYCYQCTLRGASTANDNVHTYNCALPNTTAVSLQQNS